MSRYLLAIVLCATCLLNSISSDAQVYGHFGMGYGYRPRPYRNPERNQPPFKPTINLSFGYGFPNLDKMFLPGYYGTYGGNIAETGPITGSLDYQFSRRMSLGLMVTHGLVKAPYYDYNSSSYTPAFTGRLDNWSFMLNFVNYMPVNPSITPYFRTAVGVNTWRQDYVDANGNKAPVQPVYLPDFAYQVSFGAKFNMSENAALFVEAGYGKYILQGGLAFRF